jgi:hypothetical protein
LALVRDLLSDTAIGELEKLLQGRKPFLVPVSAIEMAGFNAIPDAMTQEIGERLKLPTAVRCGHAIEQGRSYEGGRLVSPGHAGDVHRGGSCRH